MSFVAESVNEYFAVEETPCCVKDSFTLSEFISRCRAGSELCVLRIIVFCEIPPGSEAVFHCSAFWVS